MDGNVLAWRRLFPYFLGLFLFQLSKIASPFVCGNLESFAQNVQGNFVSARGPCKQGRTGLVKDVTICQNAIRSNNDGAAAGQKDIGLRVGNQGGGDTRLTQSQRNLSSFIARSALERDDLLDLWSAGGQDLQHGA